MYDDSDQIHVPKCSCEYRGAAGRGEQEYEGGTDERCAKVSDAVREPGKDVESDSFVSGEDVAKISAVKDVFKRGQDANPYRRTVFARYGSKGGISLGMRSGEKERRLTCRQGKRRARPR